MSFLLLHIPYISFALLHPISPAGCDCRLNACLGSIKHGDEPGLSLGFPRQQQNSLEPRRQEERGRREGWWWQWHLSVRGHGLDFCLTLEFLPTQLKTENSKDFA